MTADFTRWARSPRDAWIATVTAFPIGNGLAMCIGGFIAAAAGGSGDVFGILVHHGGLAAVIAVIFLFVYLGSVCTHCLYNSAVGWSNIVHGRMRVLTLLLGVVGIVVAAAGIWDYFIDWLNLLGVIVPPIGAIIIVDQLWARHDRGPVPAVRWQPFVAWAIGWESHYLWTSKRRRFAPWRSVWSARASRARCLRSSPSRRHPMPR
jgi:cytosine permease